MVDFSSLVELGFDIVSLVVTASVGILVPFAINWILGKTKIDELLGDDIVRNYLDGTINKGIEFAMISLGKKADELAAEAKITVDNPIVEAALEYVIVKTPDALDHFGITAEGLRDLTLARLNKYLAENATPIAAQ